jgi:gas vesicle protein
MGAIRRFAKFTGGGIVGAAFGVVAATLVAPQSGEELQRSVRDRIRRAKLAGTVAQAEKQEELIRRYRGAVADPEALEVERARIQAEVAQAVQSVGLGLNAPGAIAAQDTAIRQ